ncbi:dynein regulatory complex subunit 7 isoform X1 [Oreochromis aureus]|uniref:dynein regulatory complex subunit 7 isoform X1 n=1 Tax=Oreochromis aureus TaxID=47969 RepID=UPI0012BC730D|nr:dynein regulatory complex subunit 7 isoform X1 [Oreochromis aureus]XP_031606056.1 dynein regulatory complex subunit 7 isoform X1 [Oreochromis aureus]
MEMEDVSASEKLLPESYRSNSPEEIRLLAIAENFQRQYSHLCPDRKPLLLCPVNECGVKKFVSTSLRPPSTIHCELFEWQGCASFVADFLSLVPLDPPVELPKVLSSPNAVLQSQKATCFEYATLLCSLLVGEDYDAYCVSGYAVKEMCLLDQSLQECPLLDPEIKAVEDVTPEQKDQDDKYSVKLQMELKSRFLAEQEKKKREAEAALLEKQKRQEEKDQQLADPLRGLRVHCWVLVLSGCRDVQENFFIDPLTGISYPTNSDNFLGIESVWNNLNYYVNMQDCSNGCADMMFDLDDLKTWEPVLFGASSKKQLIQEVLKRKEAKLMGKGNLVQVPNEDVPKVLEMPRSWVSSIAISAEALKNRWPGGKKVIRYKQAQLERFATSKRLYGVVKRLTKYKDQDCTEVAMVKEWYQDRSDFLEEKEVDNVNEITTERFRRGRKRHLLFFRVKSLTVGTEVEMHFSSARVDDLVRRVLSPKEFIELYEGRSDFLQYRHVYFEKEIQLLSENSRNEEAPILKVVERFHRNCSKPANEDVAERVFLISEKLIELTYHLTEDRLIPSKISFIKPLDSEKGSAQEFSLDMISTFQVDLSEKPFTAVTLHKMLVELMEVEEKVIHQIMRSVKEMRDIVTLREKENKEMKLWNRAAALVRSRKRKKGNGELKNILRKYLSEEIDEDQDVKKEGLNPYFDIETEEKVKIIQEQYMKDIAEVEKTQECLKMKLHELRKTSGAAPPAALRRHKNPS